MYSIDYYNDFRWQNSFNICVRLALTFPSSEVRVLYRSEYLVSDASKEQSTYNTRAFIKEIPVRSSVCFR